MLNDRTIRVEKINVPLGQAAVVQKSYELLKRHGGLDVRLHEDLVSHKESAHHLQDRNLKREVEGCDHCHRTVGPAVSSRKLSKMVSGSALCCSEVANIVPAEVLEEVNCDFKFTMSLLNTLRAGPLNSFDEEVPHLLVLHAFNHLSADFSQHQVSLLVLEGIVEARLGALS